MPIPIITTKLYTPRPHPDLILRQQLVKRMEAGVNKKLTLISAPPGFGKTTILSTWAEQTSRPVAWLSLSETDNDLNRFLAYFVAALERVEPDLGRDVISALSSTEATDPKVLLIGLINQIAEGSDPFCVVLDDYHLINSRDIHEALLFIIENQQPRMHLLIATRADPPLPLARMRARGEMCEFREKDLRFTLEETTLFLNDLMGLALTTENILALETRTEGWIAGLHLAAISMQGKTNLDGFIRSFTGSNRYIFDYLIEEVLESQPDEIQEFMLTTSILDRMCAPLCEALTGYENCQAILQTLEAKNMFITGLDDQRRWFRYHHLFGDLLSQRLYQRYPKQLSVLHKIACNWFHENELLADAVRHALANGDFEVVAQLLEGHVFDTLERRELTILSGWLEQLPEEVIRTRPWLSTAYAWVLEETTHLDQVEKYLDQAETALKTNRELPAEEIQDIESNIHALRAKMGLRNRNFQKASSLAQKSLTLILENKPKLKGFVASLLGSALWSLGDLTGAAQAFSKGIVASSTAGDLNNAIKLYGDLAGLYIQRGQLHEANAACQEALAMIQKYVLKGGRIPRAASYIHFRLSHILFHWSDLEQSLWHAQKSEEINQQWGLRLRAAYINLADIYRASGKMEEAEKNLYQAFEIASGGPPQWLVEVEAARALLALTQGELGTASRWASECGLSVEDEIGPHDIPLYISFARVLVAQIQHGESESSELTDKFLLKFQSVVEDSGIVTYLILVLIFQAIIQQAKGNIDQAVLSLKNALSLGVSGGYIQVFVQEGEPMKELLLIAMEKKIYPEFVEKLLVANERFPKFTISKEENTSISLVDSLTPRERDVLRLLRTTLTSNEIAETLHISVATTRTHIKRIYAKLDVHNRMALIEMVNTLDLV